MRAAAKKVIAILLISLFFFQYIYTFQSAYAASPAGVELRVAGYSSGSLSLEWNAVPGAQSIRVTSANPETAVAQFDLTKAQITGLKDDTVYDIKVEIYDGLDCSGRQIGTGIIYFLPGITFKSTILEQAYKDAYGGGRESGAEPRLNLSWKMPVYWNGTQYIYINNALPQICDELVNIYGGTRQTKGISYRINISNDIRTLNGDSSFSSVNIEYTSSGYKAVLPGENPLQSDVRFNSGTGYMDFDIIGRSDDQAELPPAEAYTLPHDGIFPGTVYYMKVKPVFKTGSGSTESILKLGPPDAQNGSMLYGQFSYTYAPIRFKLTKDSEDNVYVRIYKLNQGSLDLPRLYYEVQVGDDPTISGDWAVKKTMDDSYFAPGEDYAVTVINGISSTNEVFYKIVVKSDAPNDRIESCTMPYTLREDTNKPTVPKGLQIVNREAVTREVTDADGSVRIEKTTNVTISWEKPYDWESIKANTDPIKEIYYHLIINTNQSDIKSGVSARLEADGKYYGSFPSVYRLVKYFDVLSPNVIEKGERLEYTIEGFNLFTGEDADGLSDDGIPNPEAYPDWLLPNKVYYLQMYTTKGVQNKGSTNYDDMSEKSVTAAFTTLGDTERDVPLPKDFRLGANDVEVVAGQPVVMNNFIELVFDKTNINWSMYTAADRSKCKVYYDVYMSTRPDAASFIQIGSTQAPEMDITFDGMDDQNSSIKAVIKKFTVQALKNRFGDGLRANTTYYYMVRTRLAIEGEKEDRVSAFTSILPVTTVRKDIQEPDPSLRKPLAPVDFSIAYDKDNIPELTGTSAVFNWSRNENDVAYTIIITSSFIRDGADLSEYEDDTVYQSFIKAFDGNLTVDPSLSPQQPNLEYRPQGNLCLYTINRWLYPNKLYYVSIKAVNKATGVSSTWVSIPVTTALIDAPASMEPVNDYELGFEWKDSTAGMTPDDYSIFVRSSKDKYYKLVEANRCGISKDGNNYYGRITGLISSNSYDIKVFRGKNIQAPDTMQDVVLQKNNMTTRDGFHEVEVKWGGLEGYDYELAVKSETGLDYVIMSSADMELSTSEDGITLPYYTEKGAGGDQGSNVYYARIKSIPVVMSDGTVRHEDLKSNTKYYVKVRSVKKDFTDTAAAAYSKYAGPAETRTEFSQKDYDNEEDENNDKAVLLDRIEKLEQGLYWNVAIDDSVANSVLLKGDKVINAFENVSEATLIIDISGVKETADKDAVLIPSSVVKVVNSSRKSLTIRMKGMEFILRPDTIITENSSEYEDGIADTYYRLVVSRGNRPNSRLPQGMALASSIFSLNIEVLSSMKSDKELEDDIHDILYNVDTGLVAKKINYLIDMGSDSPEEAAEQIDEYIDQLAYEVEFELSDNIAAMLDIAGGSGSLIAGTSSLRHFQNAAGAVVYSQRSDAVSSPYLLAYGSSSWMKITGNTGNTYKTTAFNIYETGAYALLLSQLEFTDLPEEYREREDILKFIEEIEMKDVFGEGLYLFPQSSITVKEVVLLYEKVYGGRTMDSIVGIKQKIEAFGLTGILGSSIYRNITRQEAAAVLIKLYAEKIETAVESITPTAYKYMADEKYIDKSFYKQVQLCLDMVIMDVREDGSFAPGSSMTRMEAISSFARLLDLLR